MDVGTDVSRFEVGDIAAAMPGSNVAGVAAVLRRLCSLRRKRTLRECLHWWCSLSLGSLLLWFFLSVLVCAALVLVVRLLLRRLVCCVLRGVQWEHGLVRCDLGNSGHLGLERMVGSVPPPMV